MLKNAPTSAIGGVDTAENEPCKVWPLSVYSHVGSRFEGGWCHGRCRRIAAVSVVRRMVEYKMLTYSDAQDGGHSVFTLGGNRTGGYCISACVRLQEFCGSRLRRLSTANIQS